MDLKMNLGNNKQKLMQLIKKLDIQKSILQPLGLTSPFRQRESYELDVYYLSKSTRRRILP